MRGEITPRRIAIAVHPIREVYHTLPRQREMQQILDNPEYVTTFGLNMPRRGYSLYVSPRHEIFSPKEYIPIMTPGVDEPRSKNIDPSDFIDYVATAPSISITLMGGEISRTGQAGCVFSVYNDIVDWFLAPDNGTIAQQLRIEMPFDTFFSDLQPFEYDNRTTLAIFRRQFSNRPEIKNLTFEEDRAIFEFQKEH